MTTRYMTGEQYSQALRDIGLSHGSIAAMRFLDLNLSTSFRYANGESPIPKQTAMLLRLMVRGGLKPEDVDSREGASMNRADQQHVGA